METDGDLQEKSNMHVTKESRSPPEDNTHDLFFQHVKESDRTFFDMLADGCGDNQLVVLALPVDTLSRAPLPCNYTSYCDFSLP